MTANRILWLVMSFLNVINIVKTTLAKGVRKRKKKDLVNLGQLEKAS